MCPPSEDSSEAHSSLKSPEFSLEERALLLQLAHDSIASAAAGLRFSPAAPSDHLAEARGVFTTVYLNGRLRGCVGYASAIAPLYKAVADTAMAAAFEDPRFPPLQPEQVPQLKVSLSVLSPLVTIDPNQVEIGRHGLVVGMGNQRGLLLPQVPVEHGWDRVTFLEQTCRKAGLPSDAWRSGAAIEAFTAEVFGDGEGVERAQL
jgi:AmmeMemoRadiSam system protein A